MRAVKKMIFIFSFVSLVLPSVAGAADRLEHDVTPGVKKIYLEPEQTLWDKGDFKFLTAVTAGYDNNTYLDSRRLGDAYMQEYFRGTFASPMSDRSVFSFDYEFMNLMYADYKKLDLVRNGIHTGIEHKIDDTIRVSGGYAFEVVEYINTGSDDYVENALDVKISHDLPYKMFHSLRYDGSYRNYSRRFNRGPAGVTGTKKRDDVRNTLNYEFGKYLVKDLLKFNFEYFNNNSDEKYLNYYDYNSYKLGISLTHLFTEKVFGYLSVSRQFRDYESRTLTTNPASLQEDKTDLIAAALFYSLNKSLSFGLNYTYRQNKSNEPVERYSGSLVSISTYYRF